MLLNTVPKNKRRKGKSRDKYIKKIQRGSRSFEDDVYRAEEKFVEQLNIQEKTIGQRKSQLSSLEMKNKDLVEQVENKDALLKKAKEETVEVKKLSKNMVTSIEVLEKEKHRILKENQILKSELSTAMDSITILQQKQKTSYSPEEQTGFITNAVQAAVRESLSLLTKEVESLKKMMEKCKCKHHVTHKCAPKLLGEEERNLTKKPKESFEVKLADSVEKEKAKLAPLLVTSENLSSTTKATHDERIEDLATLVTDAPLSNLVDIDSASTSAQKPPDPPSNPRYTNTNNEKWETQRRRGFKGKNYRQPRNPLGESASSRPAPIEGTNENPATLKTASKMAFLFLSGLAPEVNESLILKYLENNHLDLNCRCQKIRTKKDKYRSSFRLSVPYSERDNYLCSTLWPKGVIVNHFMKLQRP